MAEFNFDFEKLDEDIEKRGKSMNLKSKIIDGLKWRIPNIKKIYFETEDETGKKYKKMIIEW